MAYSVITVDLSQATGNNGTTIVEKGQSIAEIDIFGMPANATMELALGLTTDFFFVAPCTMEPDDAEAQNNSLRYRNLVPQPGVTVQLVVSFAGSKFNATLI